MEFQTELHTVLAKIFPNVVPERRPKRICLESLREVELDHFRIQFMDRLGSGSFGEVFSGYYKHGPDFWPIAIKKLKDVGAFVDRDALLNEAIIMRKLNHPNVVQLYGVCIGDREHLLISEYMDLGSLEGIIKSDQAQSLNIEDLTTIAQQISFGMCHIHNNRIVHRDLRTANVLVNSAFHVKVADFGIARFVGNNCRHRNYRDIRSDIRRRTPSKREKEYVDIMANCVAYSVYERPTFQQLEEDLTELLHIQQKRLLFHPRQPLLHRRHQPIRIPQPPRRPAFEKWKEEFDVIEQKLFTLSTKLNTNAHNDRGALGLGNGQIQCLSDKTVFKQVEPLTLCCRVKRT